MCGIVFEGDGVVDLTIIHLTRSADTHNVKKTSKLQLLKRNNFMACNLNNCIVMFTFLSTAILPKMNYIYELQ